MRERRTRVVIEHENPRVRERQAAVLETAGFDVTTCPGPSGLASGTCPLVADGHCDLVRDADVVVNGLPIGLLGVYVAQRVSLPDEPVLLCVSDRDRARLPVLGDLASTLPRNAPPETLVRAVRQAVEHGPAAPDPWATE